MTWVVVWPSIVVLNAKITSVISFCSILLRSLVIVNSSVPIPFIADKDLVNAAQAVLASLDAWLPVPGTTQADGHPIYMSRVALSALGIPTTTGVKQSIDGNRLPNTPELTTSLGLSYNFEVGNGISVVPNIYYYYQSDMYVNEFNNDLYGKVDAWDELNIGLTVGDIENQWYFKNNYE